MHWVTEIFHLLEYDQFIPIKKEMKPLSHSSDRKSKQLMDTNVKTNVLKHAHSFSLRKKNAIHGTLPTQETLYGTVPVQKTNIMYQSC